VCIGIPEEAQVDCAVPIASVAMKYPPAEFCPRPGGFVDPKRINFHPALRMPADDGRAVVLVRRPRAQKVSMLSHSLTMATNVDYLQSCHNAETGAAPSTEDWTDIAYRRRQFINMVGTFGMPKDEAAKAHEAAVMATSAAVQGELEAANAHVCSFAGYFLRRALGCQAKMLLGYPCLAQTPPSQLFKQLVNNESVPRKFAFIGVTERHDDAVCLLHTLLEADPPSANEFVNSRPGVTNVALTKVARSISADGGALGAGAEWEDALSRCGDNMELRELLKTDVLDDPLHTKATQVMQRTLARVESEFPGRMAECRQRARGFRD
jgi:hypothetical protein